MPRYAVHVALLLACALLAALFLEAEPALRTITRQKSRSQHRKRTAIKALLHCSARQTTMAIAIRRRSSRQLIGTLRLLAIRFPRSRRPSRTLLVGVAGLRLRRWRMIGSRLVLLVMVGRGRLLAMRVFVG